MIYSKKIKEKAIHYRTVGRLSLKSISKKLGISKATASYWLRLYPLTAKEKISRMTRNGENSKGYQWPKTAAYLNRPDSKFYSVIKAMGYNTSEIATISEAAVAYRLTVFGFSVFYSISDGHCIDWVVFSTRLNKFFKIQVKTVKYGRVGIPGISVLRCEGRARKKKFYTIKDLDFMIGYDIKKDLAFVYPYSDIKNKTFIVVSKDAEEAWDKLK